MQILDLDPDGDRSRTIDRFESRNALHLGLARIAGRGAVSVIRIDAGGVLGRHPAVVDQLFCVIVGDGWVSGLDGGRVAIGAGQAATGERARTMSPVATAG